MTARVLRCFVCGTLPVKGHPAGLCRICSEGEADTLRPTVVEMCPRTGKVCHPSWDEADKARRRLAWKRDVNGKARVLLAVYRCGACATYHVGTSSPVGRDEEE